MNIAIIITAFVAGIAIGVAVMRSHRNALVATLVNENKEMQTRIDTIGENIPQFIESLQQLNNFSICLKSLSEFTSK